MSLSWIRLILKFTISSLVIITHNSDYLYDKSKLCYVYTLSSTHNARLTSDGDRIDLIMLLSHVVLRALLFQSIDSSAVCECIVVVVTHLSCRWLLK